MANTAWRLEPIQARGPITRANATKLRSQLSGWGLDVVNKMASYPPQKPTRYRRTGTLGRRWTTRGPVQRGDDIEQSAGNNTDYVGYVQGLRADAGAPKRHKQTRVMAGKGWQRVDDVGEAAWKRRLPAVRRALGHK